MEKRAYYLEIPDKDICILLMDDGETQELMTSHSPGYQEVWMDMMREQGFEALGFQRTWRSYTSDGEFKTASAWHKITGERVPVGALSGLGFRGDSDAGTEADYPSA